MVKRAKIMKKYNKIKTMSSRFFSCVFGQNEITKNKEQIKMNENIGQFSSVQLDTSKTQLNLRGRK